MPYRIAVQAVTLECDTPEEVLQLLAVLTPTMGDTLGNSSALEGSGTDGDRRCPETLDSSN